MTSAMTRSETFNIIKSWEKMVTNYIFSFIILFVLQLPKTSPYSIHPSKSPKLSTRSVKIAELIAATKENER